MTEESKLPANIFIGSNSFKELSSFLKTSFSSIFVLVDENTLRDCYPLIVSSLPKHSVIQIQSGEGNKNLATCELTWHKLTEANADRDCLLINLGGGVIGDLGGFAAGCYKRGIKFINIPTTLLAMTDASVGAKTGIDLMGFKNQIGLFNQPEAVFIDPVFLKTLPERELISGFAEVIKHYLIADKDAFNQIRNSKFEIHNLNWVELIEKNIKIKTAIVNQDPSENGARKALNFGHTIGHAVESIFLNNKERQLMHGEAVAVGMITESFISMKKELLSAEELEWINDVILHYFDLPNINSFDLPNLLSFIKQDKKNVKQQTQFSLLNGIGNYSIDNSVEEEQILESLNYYNSLLE